MKFKITGKTIFNLIVIILSICLVTYFCVSKDGLMDLMASSFKINVFWLFMAIFMQLSNMFIDSYVTYLFVRKQYPRFTLWDGIKVSCVGSFFSAITPSSTGGQPMQVYLMAKKKMDVGFSTSCMLQKFLIYQITSTIISVIAIIYKFQFFVENITAPILWAFVIFGFTSQVVVTAGFFVISFNQRLSNWVVRMAGKVIHRLKFLKNTDKKISSLENQAEIFLKCNKELMQRPKLLVTSYALIAVQILAILMIPYCIYRSFNLTGAHITDILCSQAFVNLTSAMMPLPGATGAAELGFSMFYGLFFTPELLKSALLIWRMITYYGLIAISAPFSFLTKGKSVDDATAEQTELLEEECELINDENNLNEISSENKKP